MEATFVESIGKVWLLGNPSLLFGGKHKRAAVIGSRRPTKAIEEKTEDVTRYLVKNDFVTVSGLAVGVDTVAHRTTLLEGGMTVAIPGSPLDNIYPKANKILSEEIVSSGGLLLSPFAPSTPIKQGMFPYRNKVIANVVDLVIITGIAPMSGTFHVVWEANKLGIPVFAMPTDVDGGRMYGTNILIQKGDAIALDDYDILTKTSQGQ